MFYASVSNRKLSLPALGKLSTWEATPAHPTLISGSSAVLLVPRHLSARPERKWLFTLRGLYYHSDLLGFTPKGLTELHSPPKAGRLLHLRFCLLLPLSVHVLHLLLDKAKNPKLYHVIAATLFYDLSEIPSVTKQWALGRVWGEGNPLALWGACKSVQLLWRRVWRP